MRQTISFAIQVGRLSALGIIVIAVALLSGCDNVFLPVCDDGVCSAGEFALCPSPGDCDQRPECGNGACEAGESAASCPEDCGGEFCGNGVCRGDEDMSNCPDDCPLPASCGNGFCEANEDSNNCPADCGNTRPLDECAQDGDCDDEDACTADECVEGECENVAVECEVNEFCNPDTGECETVEPSAVCGDGSCTSEEDGQSCQEDCADVERFLRLVDQAETDRIVDGQLGVTEVERGGTFEEPNQAGNRITEYTEVINERFTALDKLVMTDNTIGKVYPGALLWADPIRDGRLSQVDHIPGRPPVTTSFTLVRDVEPRPQALTFEHDGSFSSFLRGAADVFDAVGSGGMRLSAEFKLSTSVEDALLSIGMSAKFWGSSMTAGLDSIQNRSRSVAVMTLDQVFYSAAVDIPTIEGFVPIRLIEEDSNLARALADRAERDGELVYVRKVDYGRRILVSLSSESSSDELRFALDTAIRALSGQFTGELDIETERVWESVEGKLIIIGGSYPPGISGFFGGDLTAFVETIRTIMTADFVNDWEGAVPVSFELAYANDNTPMQVFETVEFAGKIPARSWGLVSLSLPFQAMPCVTDGTLGHARVIQGDGEIDADDWTYVLLERQDVYFSDDRRRLFLDMSWQAIEGDHNRGFKDTHILSERIVQINDTPFANQIRSILVPNSDEESEDGWSVPPRGEWKEGDLTNIVVPISGSWGFLENIRVQVDGGGDQDWRFNKLCADGTFRVWIED